MRNVEIFLVPEFVEKTLQRKTVSMSTLLNFHKLSKFLSINDIVQLYQAQSLWNRVLGEPNCKITTSLYGKWEESLVSKEDKDLLDQVCFLNGALETKDEVVNRLIDKGPRDQTQATYQVVDLSPELYGVVIRGGYNPAQDQKYLLRDIIKAMVVYAPFNDVASSQFFDFYLRTLDK